MAHGTLHASSALRRSKRPVRLPAGDHVTTQPLRETLSAVAIESETPHTLVIVPDHRRVRLVGMHIDTNKCFLLPSAMPGIRRVKAMYDEAKTTEVLVVGHTDPHGDRRYDEQLSLERAEAVVAFLRDDVEKWNAWFSTSAKEKRWGDREVDAMFSALPEGEAPFTRASEVARDPEAIRRFQRWSNETRGTSLTIDGIAGPRTRRALIEAYMALDHTSPPKGTRIVAHGCGPNHPLPDEGNVPPTDAELRRVDLFAFDGPIRPPPPGSISSAGSSEYPQWVAQMHSTFDVGTEVLSFRYALEVGPSQQWSEAATITLFSEDLQDIETFVLANGEAAGTLGVFEFSGIRPGIRYRAQIAEGDLAVELFGLSELHAVASHDASPSHVVPPKQRPAAPFTGEDPVTDTDLHRVRLFDADGKVMPNAIYRLSIDDVFYGFAVDGWVGIVLPPSCPASCTLEWGNPDGDGTLTYRTELALDCEDGPERYSSMLHNLGYLRQFNLETRVRAFQEAHDIADRGLTPGGEIPSGTKEAIVRAHRAALSGADVKGPSNG